MPMLTVLQAPGTPASGGDETARARRPGRAVRRRGVPLCLTVLGMAATMGFSLVFSVRGRAVPLDYWHVPGDIWATLRSAHTVGWGDLGGIYGAGTGLVSLPGAALLLLPVALVSQGLGLTESFPLVLPHPSAWLVLGPYETAVSCLALFGADALAERLGVGRGRRVLLGVAGAVALFPVDAMWGHPEDAVAVGLLLFAAVAVLDRRVAAAGWCTGAAVAVQPLVLLAVPVLAAVLGARHLVAFAWRAVAPAAVLTAVPLVAAPRATLHALVDQPNFPNIDHPTPWTFLAPHLGGHGASLAVAGGPGRVVAVLLALGLVPVAVRARHRPAAVVWAMAAALALRVLTESVLDPYYVWPPLAVGLVAAAMAGRRRFAAALCIACAVTVVAEVHLPWLAWWLAVTAGTGAVVATGFPGWRLVRAAGQGSGAGGGSEHPTSATAPAHRVGAAGERTRRRRRGPGAGAVRSSSEPGVPLGEQGREGPVRAHPADAAGPVAGLR